MASQTEIAPQEDALSLVVRHDMPAWFELFGSVLGKDKKEKNRKSVPPLKANKMQAEIGGILRACREHRIPVRIVTLKGRQQGSSTFSIATLVHLCRRRNAKVCIIGDEYEKSVKNLVDMFEHYIDKDTFPWGNTYHKPSKMFSHGSSVITETANDPRAGASGTLTAVLATEVAHWKETEKISARATFAALLNCVPPAAADPDTMVIVESTPNGAGGVYHDTYKNAIALESYLSGDIPSNWNGYFKVFYPWHEHDEYRMAVSDSLREEIDKTLTDKEIEISRFIAGDPVPQLAWRRYMLRDPRFNNDEDEFDREYPSDEETCFATSGQRAFPRIKIQEMRRDAQKWPLTWCALSWGPSGATGPALMTVTPQEDAWLKLWEPPLPQARYIIYCDTATGAITSGEDPDSHGVGVLRLGYFDIHGWKPTTQVARLADCYRERSDQRRRACCRWALDTLVPRIHLLSRYYGNCIVAPELNNDRGVIELLKLCNVPMVRRPVLNRSTQTTTQELGWETTSETRPFMVDSLRAGIRNYGNIGMGLLVLDEQTLNELEAAIINDKGKALAGPGAHDDQWMGMAVGMVMLDHATTMPLPKLRRRAADSLEDDSPSIASNYTYR